MVLEHPAVVLLIVWKTELQKWRISTALFIHFLEISCLVFKFSLLLTVLKKFREKECLSWAGGISVSIIRWCSFEKMDLKPEFKK